MKDKTIICIQCQSDFAFTIAEQLRFASRGFDKPKRCPECRKKKDKAIEMNNRGKDREKKRRARRDQPTSYE